MNRYPFTSALIVILQLIGAIGVAASLVMFVDLNDGVWDPDPPDVDEAEEAMLAVAAGDVDEGWLADWLRDRIEFRTGP